MSKFCPGPEHRPVSEFETLRPFIGRWVAISGNEVLVSADSARQVVAWLDRRGVRADSMFRVPGYDDSDRGAAPN